MNRRSQLVIAVSILLSGMPLIAESAQITPDPISSDPTITTGTPLTIDSLAPLTHEGTITITTTPPLTNTGSNSSTTSLVVVDRSPIQINGTSITLSTTPTTGGISTVTVTRTPAGVPEPSSLLLLGASLAGLISCRKKLLQPSHQN